MPTHANNVRYCYTLSPRIGWGAYFWADGANPRSDRHFWPEGDFQFGEVHLSQSGKPDRGRGDIAVVANRRVVARRLPPVEIWYLRGHHPETQADRSRQAARPETWIPPGGGCPVSSYVSSALRNPGVDRLKSAGRTAQFGTQTFSSSKKFWTRISR